MPQISPCGKKSKGYPSPLWIPFTNCSRGYRYPFERRRAIFFLEVQDYSPEMDGHQLARLFKPFKRGRAGMQGDENTGLGLLIVKRIVDGYHGQIEFKAKKGQVPRFRFECPI